MSLMMTHGTRKIRESVTCDCPGRVSWVAVDSICEDLSVLMNLANMRQIRTDMNPRSNKFSSMLVSLARNVEDALVWPCLAIDDSPSCPSPEQLHRYSKAHRE